MLYEKCPNYLSKIKIVEGDIELKGLGLSEQDKNYIVEHTQILFNNAATVRFNEPIRKALQINVIGTKSALDIALEMQKLEVSARYPFKKYEQYFYKENFKIHSRASYMFPQHIPTHILDIFEKKSIHKSVIQMKYLVTWMIQILMILWIQL